MSDSKWLGAMACVALLGACGGSDGSIDTSTGAYSCDYIDTSSGDPTCRESTWSGGAYANSQWVMDCMRASGTPGEKCDREKSLGGCQSTTSVMQGDATIFLTDTYWFYKGRIATLMGICAMIPGASWVPPK